MAFFEPWRACQLVQCLKNSLCTYSVCTMWVSKVTGKINLVRLDFLEKFNDYINIRLCALAFLDSTCFVERKVKEVTVG